MASLGPDPKELHLPTGTTKYFSGSYRATSTSSIKCAVHMHALYV
eukprot:CAMPEP_0197858434 /NCGR_PEP_ID=MMETSP1438-20131217/32235_1 /TAXON_ID=1461541 /ORGANISM="Pterosperma sp., Strain CCMP1384" /LENGTH=44 /DNA_ID= /DNA_START= /DNA_END= /DNA_ORIENTATION=